MAVCPRWLAISSDEWPFLFACWTSTSWSSKRRTISMWPLYVYCHVQRRPPAIIGPVDVAVPAFKQEAHNPQVASLAGDP